MDGHPRHATPPTSRRWPPGPTPSTSFLFGTRRGYCEQISTATVVMLRSLGIPAREAVGYVPGSYNPITDLYDVQAKDAHAWVQVWFPGYGWQNFDPTANVPLANPPRVRCWPPPPATPWPACRGSRSAWCWRWWPWSSWSGVGARRRPPTWAHQVAADLERGGARLGLRSPVRRDPVRLRASAWPSPSPAERRRAGRRHRPGRAVHLRRGRAVGRPDRRGPGLHPSVPGVRPATGRAYAGDRPAGGRPGPGSGPWTSGQRLVERGPGGQQRPVGHELAGPAEGQHAARSRSPRR